MISRIEDRIALHSQVCCLCCTPVRWQADGNAAIQRAPLQVPASHGEGLQVLHYEIGQLYQVRLAGVAVQLMAAGT